MYHPTRGGTRGGAALFSWEDVKNDKDREFYLGNSVQAPTGRWQAGRDINWYTKEKKDEHAEKRKEELRAIKKMEQEAMYARLGFNPPGETAVGSNLMAGSGDVGPSKGSGANMVPLDKSKRWDTETVEGEAEGITEEDRKLAKHEVKRKMKEQRRAEKEERQSGRLRDHDRHYEERRHRYHDGDRHRRREDPDRSRDRTRSKSPIRSRHYDGRRRQNPQRKESYERRERDERETSYSRRRADSRDAVDVDRHRPRRDGDSERINRRSERPRSEARSSSPRKDRGHGRGRDARDRSVSA